MSNETRGPKGGGRGGGVEQRRGRALGRQCGGRELAQLGVLGTSANNCSCPAVEDLAAAPGPGLTGGGEVARRRRGVWSTGFLGCAPGRAVLGEDGEGSWAWVKEEFVHH